MIRAGAFLLLIALATSATAAQRGETYAPRDGRFTIRFPGKPKESEQTAKSGNGELRVVTGTYANSDGNAFMSLSLRVGFRTTAVACATGVIRPYWPPRRNIPREKSKHDRE